jgi:hypothetical protein
MTERTLCGRCHAWGKNPEFYQAPSGANRCKICDRTPAEVFADHRRVFLSQAEAKQIFDKLAAAIEETAEMMNQ